MPQSIFVDTSGWYALIDRKDAHHRPVAALVERLVRAGTRLVTTGDDNTVTILRTWTTTTELLDFARTCCVARQFTQAEAIQFGLP